MFRPIITLLMICSISLPLYAQEIELNKNHPERYVVVKGDTLWGISGKFLKDPWKWPKIWNLNRQEIKNPHLIYPGDVVILDYSGKNPRLRLLHETVTLNPHSVEEPIDKAAISTIPLSVISPFLHQPLVIEKDQLATSPRILAAQDNRVVLSPDTRIYIKGIKEGDALNWHIYRSGENLVDPVTKEILGVEANYLGDARLVKYGDPASADIIKAKEEIFVKDRLVAMGEELTNNFVPHAPETKIDGRIIKIYGGVAEGGPESIVTLNLGAKNGMEVGHVLAINRYGRIVKDNEYQKPTDNSKPKEADADGKIVLEPGMVKLPDERIGLLMVFRVFDRVSYALVMQASQPVYALDSVNTP
ncbi:MAG: LysM peptidoglycan-binding domain-containing protein [Methylophilaceae bacterium]